jgi:hypothetical protein
MTPFQIVLVHASQNITEPFENNTGKEYGRMGNKTPEVAVYLYQSPAIARSEL